MYFDKRYLQFNELVFDGYDMISDYDEPLQYKGSSIAYSYTHGSYRAFQRDYLYVSERQVNMTITLKTKKLPCEYREFYVRFAEQELGKPGKLWAIKNNEIIWAIAAVNNLRPVNSRRKDEVVFDVEFVIPGGVWHKADKQRTFLLPYNVCSLMECKKFDSFNPVAYSKGSENGCEACEDNRKLQLQEEGCGCCCDNEPSADMALGFHLDELQRFYSCDTPYQLEYNCIAASKYNLNKAFGQKLCAKDSCGDAIITGQFYSDTDIPTDDLTLTLIGDMVSPRIKINGNLNIITGEYHGKLTINSSGDIYYEENKCCGEELLDPSVWVIPEGNDYGWTVNPQYNGIIVEMNTCCGSACVYVDHTPITT